MRRVTSFIFLLAACHGGPGTGGDDSPTSPGGGAAPSGPPAYPGAGSGTHYWVHPAGSDGNPGTPSAPWRTLDRLETATFAPGDLVHVQPGTYMVNGSLTLAGIHGSPGAWIGLQAEGAVTIRNTAAQNVVTIEGCRYLFLRGFEITHDNAGQPYGSWDAVDGIKFQTANSEFVTIDSCRIHDVGNVGIGSQVSEIRNVTVWECEIYNCYTGLYWGYYESPVKNYAHYGRIARNYVHDCPPIDLDGTGYGIQIKGGSRGNVIEDNVFVNVGGGTRAAIAVYHISTDQGAQTDRNVVRRNFIRASRNEGIYAAEGATIENNIVCGCRTIGVNVAPRDTGGWGVFFGGLTVRNNTVYSVTDAAGIGLRVDGAGFSGGLVVANNLLIVTGAARRALAGPTGFGGTATANLCHGPTSGSNLGIVALAGPSVQSATYGTAGFLRPIAPASASGDAALAPADDFDGAARGNPPGAGAYGPGGSGWTLADGFKL